MLNAAGQTTKRYEYTPYGGRTVYLDSPWNRAKGDMNGDGVVNASDVSPFETALSNLASYHSTYPMLDGEARGDCNGDGAFNSSDVSAFEGLIAQTLVLPFVSHAPTLQSRRSANDIALNDIGHQGLMHDEEFQTAGGSLIHNRARTLHPGLGRFVQRDPLGDVSGPNLYEYVRSNPFAYVDPSGETPLQVFCCITAAVLTAKRVIDCAQSASCAGLTGPDFVVCVLGNAMKAAGIKGLKNCLARSQLGGTSRSRSRAVADCFIQHGLGALEDTAFYIAWACCLGPKLKTLIDRLGRIPVPRIPVPVPA